MKKITACLGLAFVCNTFFAGAAQLADHRLCVGTICLGMDMEELSKQNLQPPGMFGFAFSKGMSQNFGLGPSGPRVWFTSGDVDAPTIKQFQQKVKIVCVAESMSANSKASDGQRIRILLRPAIVEGKGKFIVNEIARYLPPNHSATEMQNVEAQAREKYGDAFVKEWSFTMKKPSARIRRDVALGTSLTLALPIQDVRKQLMEQPGCSEKVRLD